jgi:hypothetical protein
MADPDNLINVEDDTPVPETPPVVPVAAAPPADPPAPDPPADPTEHEAVEIQGGKYVPLAALRTVRDELKSAREKASDNETLRQRLAQLEGQVQGYQEIAQQLRQPAAPVAPTTDPRALAFAQKLDLYTQDDKGQAVPDVAKAAAILSIVEEVADQKTSSRLGPMLQQTARERALNNYQWALQVKDPVTQQPIPKPLIDEVFKMMGMEAAANPEIAKTLLFAAAGMERMTKSPQPAAPVAPPVVTEGVGGNPRARPILSQLEKSVAKERGVDEATWAKHTTGFTPGRTVTLED